MHKEEMKSWWSSEAHRRAVQELVEELPSLKVIEDDLRIMPTGNRPAPASPFVHVVVLPTQAHAAATKIASLRFRTTVGSRLSRMLLETSNRLYQPIPDVPWGWWRRVEPDQCHV